MQAAELVYWINALVLGGSGRAWPRLDNFLPSGIMQPHYNNSCEGYTMTGITLENITEAVINHGDKGKTNPRLHEIYASLVKHLHAFQKEVNLTTAELDIGRQFLFRLAQPNQDFPMGEIHLMTDCLGISEVSILLEDAPNDGTTEMNVEGALFIGGLPE